MRSLAMIAALRLPVLCVAASLVPLPARAQDEEEEPQAIHAQVRIIGEYDDNVGLSSGIGPSELLVDDYVLRATPSVTYQKRFGQHNFEIALDGDLRRGLDSDLSDINGGGLAALNFIFDGGLSARVSDSYERTEFDQAVYFSGKDFAANEVGVRTTDANTARAELSFRPPRSRFAAQGSYQRRDETYGYLDSTDDQRDIERFDGNLALGLHRSWSIYGSGAFERQRAVVRPEFGYDDQGFSGGLRFRGRNRVSAFAEVGQQELDFVDTVGVEESRTVFRGGIDTEFNEVTLLKLSAGRDVFGEAEMQAVFSHSPGDGSITLMARRSTEKSFSLATADRTFRATFFGARLAKDLGQRVNVEAQVSYFRLQSDTALRQQDDKTLVISGSLDYLLRHWVRLGIVYRYASRTADIAESEFDSNRAGLSVVFVY